jgi:transcription elongation factor
MDFLTTDESGSLLLPVLHEEFLEGPGAHEKMSNESSRKILSALLQKTEPEVTITINRNRRYLMVAAAVAAIATGIFFLTPYFRAAQTPAKNISCAQRFKNDVQPGSNKAVLTLGDGRKLDLDDAQNGTLAKQGNTAVIKISVATSRWNNGVVKRSHRT